MLYNCSVYIFSENKSFQVKEQKAEENTVLYFMATMLIFCYVYYDNTMTIKHAFNLLRPVECDFDSKYVIFKGIVMITLISKSSSLAFRRMTLLW